VKVENVSIGSATVTFDETKTTVGDLVDAVSDAGYEASEAA
jgi:copper chaperone CopZ